MGTLPGPDRQEVEPPCTLRWWPVRGPGGRLEIGAAVGVGVGAVVGVGDRSSGRSRSRSNGRW